MKRARLNSAEIIRNANDDKWLIVAALIDGPRSEEELVTITGFDLGRVRHAIQFAVHDNNVRGGDCCGGGVCLSISAANAIPGSRTPREPG